MKRYSRELIIGVSVLIALLVLFFGIDYLKGINVFKAANYYYVSYTNVNGLTVSSPVTINGFKVGQVRDINYEYDNPGHVLVELSLDKKLKVPSGSKAIIKSDLLGTASVELQFSTSADSHDVGDKLIGEAMPSMLDNVASELMPTVSSIFPKVDSLLTSVNRLVSDSALLSSVKRLDKITANLEATTVNLNRTLATMPKVMTTVDGVALNLDTITANLALVSQELKEMPIESTLQNVHDITADMKVLAGKLNSTDNSLGLLLNDRGLYDHLNGAAGGLDSLLFDVKKNPKRYIPPIKVF
ncbi:MlaD family protein [Muribaculum sp. NM65_B17]|jgi:mce family protein|uniref:MlaD family protein n=2 Tax=Muribaculum TaxID=1918540 RepID=UPI000F4948E5|nr:MlaD family protein [Muribaculum sp. NM65_B17]ROT14286.1 MCE family protein [Muribaculaceae bacterium Isolate-102 (HZI)]TGY03328.1 MCE family protein [Muribaculum sp. NM65_B17]THG42730.1 MCE family protein [Muribaculaceae bacterium]